MFKKRPQKEEKKTSPLPKKDLFPMRINKYLAMSKYSTRRGADELIEQKKVTINGKAARLGDKVNEGDKVLVNFKGKEKKYIYYAYNKPKGLSTNATNKGEKDVRSTLRSIPEMKDVFPLGRLDKESEGLIILTNDGRITDKLLNPIFDHEKEYVVKTVSPLRNNFKEKIEKGINIEGYTTKPCKVKVLGENSFSIILTEGKKHQIRRMVVALFNEVKELRRIRIMNVSLLNLPSGNYREISGEELKTFLEGIGF